jgi:hypothetical protein
MDALRGSRASLQRLPELRRAFTDLSDAQRWAAKKEWEFYQCVGEGNVGILTVNAEGLTWEVDSADPLSQAGTRARE